MASGKVNKGKCGKLSKRRDDKTSLNLGLDKITEALVLALMVVLFIMIFYSGIELLYKIVASVLVFGIIFLIATANQTVKQRESINH